MLRYKGHIFLESVYYGDGDVYRYLGHPYPFCPCNRSAEVAYVCPDLAEAERLYQNHYAGLSLEEFLVRLGFGTRD